MKETEPIFNFSHNIKTEILKAVGSNETAPPLIVKYQHELSAVSKFIDNISDFLQI